MKKLLFAVCVLMLFVISAGVFADADYLEVSVPSTTRDAAIPAYFLLPEGDASAVVVLIHGHHGNHNEWGGYDIVADGLAANGIIAAELDFPGCGASAEDYHLNAMSYMCNDVLDVINYAKETYGVTKVGAMGYSMGGRIVSQMLIEDMIDFDSIAFVAPAVSLANMIDMFGGQENYDMMKETIKGTDDMYPFPGAFGEQLLSNEFFTDLEAYGEDMAELAAAEYDGNSLTIYSTDDYIVDPAVSQACADAFGSTVVTVNNLGHSYNFYGQDPTTVNALNVALVTFFADDLADPEEEEVKSYADYVDVPWTEHFVDLTTGIRLCYVEIGPEDGTPIVLLHGVTDGRISWTHVAPALADLGYHVYIPEYRGNGKTDKPEADENGYTADMIADDIIAFMDAIGLEKAHVAGHSYGSMIAQMINLKAPEKLLSTILIDTTVNALTSEVLEWAEFGDGTDYLGVHGYDEEGAMPDDFLVAWAENSNPDEAFQKANIEHLRQMPYACWYNLLHACRNFDNSEHIGEISGKVLVIWGTGDEIFPAADQDAVKAGLTGCDVTYVDIEGSHNIHWDGPETTAAVVDAINAFISAID